MGTIKQGDVARVEGTSQGVTRDASVPALALEKPWLTPQCTSWPYRALSDGAPLRDAEITMEAA